MLVCINIIYNSSSSVWIQFSSLIELFALHCDTTYVRLCIENWFEQLLPDSFLLELVFFLIMNSFKPQERKKNYLSLIRFTQACLNIEWIQCVRMMDEKLIEQEEQRNSHYLKFKKKRAFPLVWRAHFGFWLINVLNCTFHWK